MCAQVGKHLSDTCTLCLEGALKRVLCVRRTDLKFE